MNQIDFGHRQVGVDVRDVHRTVEVHLADGEQFWLWVAAGSFEEVADRLLRRRNLVGRFVGCARDEHDARRMIVPVEQIKLVVDIDG